MEDDEKNLDYDELEVHLHQPLEKVRIIVVCLHPIEKPDFLTILEYLFRIRLK